jgi:hypothetical protein
MPSPIRFELMVLLAKIEGTYGTDPTPTGAANAMLVKKVEISPMEGEDISRELMLSYLGGQATIPTGLHVVLKFETELAGSGAAGIAPDWGPLARSCKLAETIVADTSVTYNPISDAMESTSFYFWIGNIKHVSTGARGDAVIKINAQGIPVIAWTFTGLWAAPAEAAAATPTLTRFIKPLIASKANTPAFTVNSVALVLRSYSLALKNDVQRRFLIGREEVFIQNSAEQLDLVVETAPLSTFNPYSLAAAQTLVPVSIVHGTVAGNIVTIDAATAQLRRPGGYQNNQGVAEQALSLNMLPSSAGNDQFSLALT